MNLLYHAHTVLTGVPITENIAPIIKVKIFLLLKMAEKAFGCLKEQLENVVM